MLTAAQIAHGGACRSDLSSVCLKSALQIPASGTVKCVLVSSKAGRVSRRMIASSPSGGVGAVSASDRREVGDPLRLVLLGGIRQKSDDVGTQPVRFRKSQLLVDDPDTILRAWLSVARSASVSSLLETFSLRDMRR
jgi:hypothetical protein